MDARLKRIHYEVALAAVRYSRTHSADFDDESGSWVIIKDFPLPAGYNYETTDILVLLPPNYPQTPPDWFYVDDNLRLADGRRPSHVFYGQTTHDPNARSANRDGGCAAADEGLDGVLPAHPFVAARAEPCGGTLTAERVRADSGRAGTLAQAPCVCDCRR
jgi:hypothetical protein